MERSKERMSSKARDDTVPKVKVKVKNSAQSTETDTSRAPISAGSKLSSRERSLGMYHYTVRLEKSQVSRAVKRFTDATVSEQLDGNITYVTAIFLDGELSHWTCLWGSGLVTADFAVRGADTQVRLQLTEEGRASRAERLRKLYGERLLAETWVLNPTRLLDGEKWKYSHHMKLRPAKTEEEED